MKGIKLVFSIATMLFVVIMTVTIVYKRHVDEIKIKKNPCYVMCSEIKIVTLGKGIKSFNYTFIVNGKTFYGQSAAGDIAYREKALRSKLTVIYVCNKPEISRLIVSDSAD